MKYQDQTNKRRFAFTAMAAYAVAAMAAGAVPLMTFGLFPDLGGEPLLAQQKLASVLQLMEYAQLATLVTATIAVVATASWVQGAWANLEALPSASAPMHRWLATLLVLVPGINLVGGPVVMWLLMRQSREAAGERGDWFRFTETQLIGAWVGTMIVSAAIMVYVATTFEARRSLSALANLQLLILTMRVVDMAFVGIAAMILHRVDQLQDAVRGEVAVEHVFD